MKISDLTPLQEKQLRAYCSYLEMKNEEMEREREKKIESARNDFTIFSSLVLKELRPQYNLKEKWIKVCQDAFQHVINDNNENSFDRLIINIRPRLGKTTFITILGVLWLFGRFPDRRILIATASNKLKKAIREGGVDLPLNIVLSECQVYKKIFPDLNIIANNDVLSILNSKGGVITLTVAGSTAIGLGYHYIFFDDFFNPNDVSSEASSETAKEHLKNFLTRKEHNPKTKVFGIEQRIHLTNDFTGSCLEYWQKFKLKFKHIVIENETTEPRQFILSNGDIVNYEAGEWIDSRANETEKQSILADLRGDLIAYQCLYQQSPSASSGKFFDKIDIEAVQIPISEINNKKNCHYMISVDTAGGNNEQTGTGDFTAIAILKYSKEENILYMENIFQLDLKFTDLANRLMMIAENIKTTGANFSILIEENHIGAALQNHLETVHKINNIRTIKRTSSMRKGNMSESLKEDMARSMVLKIFAKKIFFPRDGEIHNMTAFKNEMLQFPKGKHDDMIDAVSNCIYYLAEKFRY